LRPAACVAARVFPPQRGFSRRGRYIAELKKGMGAAQLSAVERFLPCGFSRRSVDFPAGAGYIAALKKGMGAAQLSAVEGFLTRGFSRGQERAPRYI
jgi:hypothetical protein